ncbi:thymidine kinase [Mycoplasmopsis alligatoris]|uniref:Thymidine kinase n=1 Tax=Mycoplasmopsis alligatoris A21JP2 TaxID=747682 RepID=D4XW53_9BACT|nr:thymidine kinase [Mycoplasmopsis alligatoris]EFF41406.1 thymidine kinase [Mycoplasmopsis alligatoris A21JP2]
MFLKHNDGTIEVITGPMFSGKSEELLKRINILSIAKIKTLIIKPAFDTRFKATSIVSRNGSEIEAIAVKDSSEILKAIDNTYKAVAIDELNFFDEGIIQVVQELRTRGIRIIVSGLDMDFMALPFGVVPAIMALSDEVLKLKAVCFKCHSSAAFTYRKVKSNEQNLLGDSEYEARCWHCHQKGMARR